MRLIALFMVMLLWFGLAQIDAHAMSSGATPYQKCYANATKQAEALQPGLNLANPNTQHLLDMRQTVLTTTGEKGHVIAAEYNWLLDTGGNKILSPLKGSSTPFPSGAYRAYYDPTKPTLDLMVYFTAQGTFVDKCECTYLGKDC